MQIRIVGRWGAFTAVVDAFLFLSNEAPHDLTDCVAEARAFTAINQSSQVCQGPLIEGELNPLHTQSHTPSITYTYYV